MQTTKADAVDFADISAKFPRIIRERRFLIEDLPAPLTRASEHLQLFDNYITNTRLCLRKTRVPQTRQWSYQLRQQYQPDASNLSLQLVSEIELNELEYATFEVFEGNELRYNRYFAEYNERTLRIDFCLNRELWNLIVAGVTFDSESEQQDFIVPPFVMREITNDLFFAAASLADTNLEEVRRHLAR